MADLKLEVLCPHCGEPNAPAAARCRQCAYELDSVPLSDWPTPAPFDLPGATRACIDCGAKIRSGKERCVECQEPTYSRNLVEEAMQKAARLRQPARAPSAARPQRVRLRLDRLNLDQLKWDKLRWKKPSLDMLRWGVKLVSALYLIWNAVDCSYWLSGATAGLANNDPAALRYTMHAVFELVRSSVLVGAVWLLASLRRPWLKGVAQPK